MTNAKSDAEQTDTEQDFWQGIGKVIEPHLASMQAELEPLALPEGLAEEYLFKRVAFIYIKTIIRNNMDFDEAKYPDIKKEVGEYPERLKEIACDWVIKKSQE